MGSVNERVEKRKNLKDNRVRRARETNFAPPESCLKGGTVQTDKRLSAIFLTNPEAKPSGGYLYPSKFEETEIQVERFCWDSPVATFPSQGERDKPAPYGNGIVLIPDHPLDSYLFSLGTQPST